MSQTTVFEMQKKAERLIDDVGVLLESGTMEEKQKIPAMLEDIKKIKSEIDTLKTIEEARAEIKQYANPANGGSTNLGASQGKFGNFGEFLKSVHTSYQSRDARLKAFNDKDESAGVSVPEQKDMTGQTGSGGGYLIPVEQYTNLMGLVQERSFVRPRATVIPMTRRQVNIPVLDQTSTTSGQPHWFGGLRAYWTEEATTKVNSDPTFRQVTLTAWKLIMYTRASDELLDDSAVSLAAFLSGQMGFAGAISWMEEWAFLNGTGAGQPLGVLNSPALLTFNRAGSGAIGYTDLTGILKRFLPNSKGLWTVSQSAMQQLLELSGPSGNASYLWGSAVNGAPNTLLGYPVQFTEKAPALGSVGDIALIDWSYYLIGDRQATTVESTKFDRWSMDETSWRAVHRVDGRPWLSTYMTFQDGSTQVSPFVALNAN